MKCQLAVLVVSLAGAVSPASGQSYGSISQNDDYLLSQKEGIRLSLARCQGGDGPIFVIGQRPDARRCVNVHYHVRHVWGENVDHGQIMNFAGGGSCYGDTKAIRNVAGYALAELQVTVDDVSYCE